MHALEDGWVMPVTNVLQDFSLVQELLVVGLVQGIMLLSRINVTVQQFVAVMGLALRALMDLEDVIVIRDSAVLTAANVHLGTFYRKVRSAPVVQERLFEKDSSHVVAMEVVMLRQAFVCAMVVGQQMLMETVLFANLDFLVSFAHRVQVQVVGKFAVETVLALMV